MMQDKIFVPNNRIERYGTNSARTFHATGLAGAERLRKIVRADLRIIQKTAAHVTGYMANLPQNDSVLLPAEFVWLSENLYRIEKTCSELRVDLHGKYQLTVDAKGNLFIFQMASALLRTGAEAITPERLTLFLRGVQAERILNESECLLFLPVLRITAIRMIRETATEIQTILKSYQNEKSDSPFGAEKRLRAEHLQGSDPISLDTYAAPADRIHRQLEAALRGTIKLLNHLAQSDFLRAMRTVSRLEAVLMRDPDGTYPRMSEPSQAYYRTQLTTLARHLRVPEYVAAESLLNAAASAPKGTPESHIGWHIVRAPALQKRTRKIRLIYLTLDMTLPVLFSALFGILFKSVWLALGMTLPLYEVTRAFLLYLFSHMAPNHFLPSLELEAGVPESGTTLAAVTLLAATPEQAAQQTAALAEYACANRSAGDHVLYGVLADLPDASSEETDDDPAILDAMRTTIDRLNQEYGHRFVCIWRKRYWNDRDQIWMAYERKRGAITALAAFVSGDPDPNNAPIFYGMDAERLKAVRYLIALDADTIPEPDSIRHMVGAMMHPLNRAVIAPDASRVVAGYGILQPHITMDLTAANATLFSRIFAGQGGTDPYCVSSGDICQNLFGDAIFTGKGILDLQTMHTVMKDKISDLRILSHDLLEGSFLRTGFLAEASVIDGFPSSVRSFLKRQARWTRGDIQLIPFLFPYLRDKQGQRYRNPLTSSAKYRICDNIRRAETPAAICMAILSFCVFRNPASAVGALFGLAALTVPMLLNTVERLRNFPNRISTRCHSTIYAGFRGGLLLFFSRFVLLPFEAYVTTRAMVQALWRMLFSKRRLLEWTTAAEAEKHAHYRRTGFGAVLHEIYVFLPSVILAILLCAVAGNPISCLVSLLWLLSPLYSFLLSGKLDRSPVVSSPDQAFLKEQAQRIWWFFDDRMTEADQNLPPDNEQIAPCGIIAHRTSPTNIGLGILSVFAAEKLGFISWDDAEKRLMRIISALERMEKNHGHLYNWYRTDTLTVMLPAVISSVDSGNLCASLLAAAQLAHRHGSTALGERMEQLARLADFSVFYDDRVHLLHIAVDRDGKSVGGHYDMLASEARLTSYLAIAKGEIPVKHWFSLSRSLSETNGYTGLVSWSGSLFEYLMPNLLLPETENSLLYEANRYAVYCQRIYAKKRKMPWGISESAFYAFDETLTYQYKAHGVPAIGLKNGLEHELVVSPYSSYLALSIDPDKALRNLRVLNGIDGMQGKYGLYEAADWTGRRMAALSENRSAYRVCKTYMAHHMAMSLCSICNLLTAAESGKGYFVDAFFDQTDIRAYHMLLAERMPIHAVNVKRMHVRASAEQVAALPEYRLHDQNALNPLPHWNLLANDGCTLLTSTNGASRLFTRQTEAYHAEPGVFVLFQTDAGIFSPVPIGQATMVYQFEWTGRQSRFLAESASIRMKMHIQLAENEPAEVREVQIQNTDSRRICGHLVLFLEPLAGRLEDYESHPDFYRMFLSTEAVQNGAVANRNRGSSIALICEPGSATFTSDGDAILAGNFPMHPEACCSALQDSSFGTPRRPVLRAVIPVVLAPGETFTFHFAIALGESMRSAVAAGSHALRTTSHQGLRFCRMAQRLSLQTRDLLYALSLLTPMMSPYERPEAAYTADTSRGALWQLGISGDLPVVVLEAYSEDLPQLTGEIFTAIRIHALFSACGISYDLCILIDDGGTYERRGFHLFHAAVRIGGCAAAVGVHGGIHLIDLSAADSASVAAVRLVACAVLPYRSPSFPPALPHAQVPAQHTRTWSQPLCNQSFGCLSTDFGMTHLWFRNARLMKLTPLDESERGEELSCLVNGRRIPILCGAVCSFEQGYTVWETEIDGQSIRTRAFVAPDRPLRILIIEAPDHPVTVDWRMHPLFGERRSAGNGVITSFQQKFNAVTAYHPLADDFPPTALACSAAPAPSGVTCSEAAYRSGLFCTPEETVPCGRIAAFRITGQRIVLTCAAADSMEDAVSAAGSVSVDLAEQFFHAACEARKQETKQILIRSGNSVLDAYMNDWAAWQIKGSRLYARSSFYQNGGAIGFRDQMQDASAFLLDEPQIMRALLLLCAAHQYEEGDVQHWFHVGFKDVARKNGVRTRCSDDLLWLPYFTALYLDRTGEDALLSVPVPYLKSEPLRPDERERYENAEVSPCSETLYQHGLRAIHLFLARGCGAHHLPLILNGDWNDGLNGIGEQGKGESVWLAWFGSLVLRRFATVCCRMKDSEEANRLLATSNDLRLAAMRTFETNRFLRAFTDDGTVLGSARSKECQLDSIAQSFAWLSSDGSESEQEYQQMQLALQTALEQLVDRKNRIVRLFTPPFTRSANVGYLSDYPTGVRENGGQYTHAAVWLAMACFRAGRPNDGWELLRMLLPKTHDPSIYGGEDFVLAADVYAGEKNGVCGWSWYTGSAAWFRKAVVEEMLGIRGSPQGLTITPNLPDDMPTCSCRLRFSGMHLHLKIHRSANGQTHFVSWPLTGEEVDVEIG